MGELIFKQDLKALSINICVRNFRAPRTPKSWIRHCCEVDGNGDKISVNTLVSVLCLLFSALVIPYMYFWRRKMHIALYLEKRGYSGIKKSFLDLNCIFACMSVFQKKNFSSKSLYVNIHDGTMCALFFQRETFFSASLFDYICMVTSLPFLWLSTHVDFSIWIQRYKKYISPEQIQFL